MRKKKRETKEGPKKKKRSYSRDRHFQYSNPYVTARALIRAWTSCKALSLVNFNEDPGCPVYSTRDTGYRLFLGGQIPSISGPGHVMACDGSRSPIPPAPSFYQPRPSRVRNCKLDPNDLLLRSQNLRKPRYRLLFLVSALHSTDSTMIVRKARELTPAKSEILLIPSGTGPPLRQRIGEREWTAFRILIRLWESSRIAFAFGFINVARFFRMQVNVRVNVLFV